MGKQQIILSASISNIRWFWILPTVLALGMASYAAAYFLAG
jgi:hypothetical protein